MIIFIVLITDDLKITKKIQLKKSLLNNSYIIKKNIKLYIIRYYLYNIVV